MDAELKVTNKILIIKGILAEKCGISPELYDKLSAEFDELSQLIIGLTSESQNANKSSDPALSLSDVNNLAKFCKNISQQKDCPDEFIDIVNKEFWNLI